MLLDNRIRSRVRKEINDEEIVFLVPKLIDWKGDVLRLSVFIRSAKSTTGPLDDHCYRVELAGPHYENVSAMFEQDCDQGR